MAKVMNGSVAYPMSARVQDTIKVHGFMWAYEYYVLEHGFAAWEFFILAGVPQGLKYISLRAVCVAAERMV